MAITVSRDRRFLRSYELSNASEAMNLYAIQCYTERRIQSANTWGTSLSAILSYVKVLVDGGRARISALECDLGQRNTYCRGVCTDRRVATVGVRADGQGVVVDAGLILGGANNGGCGG